MAEGKKAKEELKADKKAAESAVAAAPAEGAEGAEGAAAPPSGSGRKKIIMFVVLPLLLIIAGGGGAYFAGLFDRFLPQKPPNCATVKDGDKDFATCAALKAASDGSTPGVFVDIPPMIVNLNSSSKQPRFLRISLKVEVADDAEKTKLDAALPLVVDQFQMYLRELRIEDLRGTSGIYRMKIELLSRIRAAAPNVKIRDVLFQEVLVQ